MSQDALSIASTSPRNPEISNGSTQSRRASSSTSAKKGGRNLTAAQLEKKRANDREAQRNIRVKTKNLIESLEHEIQVLKSGEAYQQLQVAIREKEAVQAENLELRSKLASILDILRTVSHNDPLFNDNVNGPGPRGVLTEKRESSTATPGYSAQPPVSQSHLPTSQPSFSPSLPNTEGRSAISSTRSTPWEHQRPEAFARSAQNSYAPRPHEAATSERHYPSTSVPMTGPIKAELTPPFSRHSTSGDNCNGFHAPIGTSYAGAPPGPMYSLLPANISPTCDYDRIVYDFTIEGKHYLNGGRSLDSICGGSRPILTRLTDVQPSQAKDEHYLSDLLISLLKGFSSITGLPEKIGVVSNMFEYMRWIINPIEETYNAIPPYMRPVEEQLRIPHPIWVDYLPWPAMRLKLLYEYPFLPLEKFFYPYCKSLKLDFPGDVRSCLDRDPETGEMYCRPELHHSIHQIDAWSVGRDFSSEYPHLAETCRVNDN